MSLKVGQRVIINKGQPSQAYGLLSGSRIENDSSDSGIHTMYIVLIDPEYRGYSSKNNGDNSYIGMLLVNSDNIQVIE